LTTFSRVYNFDYAQIRAARGESLVIWASETVYDFAVITLDFDGNVLKKFNITDTLTPEMGVVINNYTHTGDEPQSGITFKDENGKQRYYAMQRNESNFPNVYDIWEIKMEAR